MMLFFELWTTQDSYDRDTLLEYAKKWQVCPFEMCLDLAVWVDAVICDYNYVFDPNVYLKRFFGEGTSGEYIFLIDEAHNLVDRGREMYSAHVDRADVLEAKRLAGDYSKGLVRALEKVNRQLRTLEKECTEFEILPNPRSSFSGNASGDGGRWISSWRNFMERNFRSSCWNFTSV